MSEQDSSTSELSAEEQTQLKALDENLAKFEGLKRWSDVIKTLLARAELAKDPAQKIADFTRAGELYIEKSSNQAEAIKAYARVLELDRTNVEAITKLKDMYEKRRDWEKLVDVMRVEVELMDELDKPLRYIEIADLSTQKLRKPEISIELWQKVLEFDASNPRAIEALAGLFERARDWSRLAEVLERQVEHVDNENDRVNLLLKLGGLYGDKLNDDRGAVRAFQRLLELRPDERRAQEQLKKRYAALRDWDALESFYSTQDKWDELIRVFEREGDDANVASAERIDLLSRVARLWAEKKDKPDRAARSYEKVLELDPDNLDAAVALSPIYEQGKDPKRLAAVYEVRLKHVEELEERLVLLRETGLLYEERIKDAPAALAKFLEAFTLAPEREQTREDAARLAAVVPGGFEQLIAAYDEAISATADPSAVTDLRLSAGSLLARVGKVDEAIEQLVEVYEAEPDNMKAAQALEPLYRQTGRFKDVLEIYRKRQDAETDPEQRRQLAYRIAALSEHELALKAEAIEHYKQILEEYGDEELEAYRALERLYEEQGEFSELAQVLQRRIDLAPEPGEEAELKFRLARVLETRLSATGDAIELYREILTTMPDHAGARGALEALLEDEKYGKPAAEILAPMYEQSSRWEELVRALEVLVAGTSDREEQHGLLSRIGEVSAGPLDDGQRSFEAYMRALRAVPSNEQTMEHLEALALELEQFPVLVELVVQLAKTEPDPAQSRALYLRAAEHYATQLGDMEGAVRAYNRILENDPSDETVLDSLQQLYAARGRWHDLLGVLRRKAELTTDPAVKEQLLVQMADVHRDKLDEVQEAIARYREILEIDPASPRALSALDQLYEVSGMWAELADNVQRQLDLADEPEQQTAYMLRLASLREQRMGAVEGAIEIYREVLSRDPDNAPALAALERLLKRPENEAAIADILEPLYRQAGEYQKLIGVHEIQARHASSVELKVQLLHTIAELYETALDDLPSAVTTYARALSEEPSNESTQAQLERVAIAADDATSLARIYEREVALVNDPMVAAQLHVKAAQLRENMLHDAQAAIAHYRKVLELDPSHLEAASALERLYQGSASYEELAGTYLIKASMLQELDDRKQYLWRAAQIFEDVLQQPLRAVDVHKQVLELDPEDATSLDKLIDLFLKLERWEDLLAVYGKRADIVASPEEKKALLAEMGAVYERELRDDARAIDTYQRILEVDPDDRAAIARLDALYLSTENWPELLSMLEREVDLTGDPYEAVSYRYRIAELYDQRLNDSARAVEGFRDILELAPDHEPTLNALEAMIAGKREPMAAAEVLEPVYRQLGEWQKLASVMEVRVQYETDAVRKVELLHALAQLSELQLESPSAAFAAYGRSLALEPGNPETQEALERLAEQLGTWSDVTKLYDQAVEQLRQRGDGSHLELALRAAQIYELSVEDVEAAIERYKLVIEVDPTHATALEALDRLYEQTGRNEELADVLRREVEVAPTPDDVLHLQFRLGQVLQTRLSRVDDAVSQYREILAAAPEYQPAVRSLEMLFAERKLPLEIGDVLEPLYRMQGSWNQLIGVHEVQLEHQADPSERVAMMHRVAEIAEDKAKDSRLAFLWMQRALLEEPKNEHTEGEVERLAKVTGGWAVLANTYADVVGNGAGREVKVALGRKLARIYEGELHDIERAEETHRFVLGIDKADEETLEALDRIYSEHAAYEALSEVLKMRVQAARSDYEKVELSFRLGQTLELELGRLDEAIAVYAGILDDLDPEHEPSVLALERAYTAKGDWQNLYATYERALKVVLGDANQAEIYGKMARLSSEHLNDGQKAVELWKQVLDLRGEDPEALRALALLYTGQSNFRDLVDILEREAAVADSDEERIRSLMDLGRTWYERLERAKSALESYERVLDIDPAYTPALFAIADIHRRAKSTQELVDTLHRTIEVGAAQLDEQALERVYMELGATYDQVLKSPGDAVEAYMHAIDVNEKNFAAMDALERIHTEQRDFEARIAVRERRAIGFSDDPEQRRDVLLSIARSWNEDIGDRARGVSALSRVLELEPLHNGAFDELESIFTELESWDQLVELYLARVEVTEDGGQRIALLQKVAKIYETQLEDPQQAFDAMLVAWTENYQNQKVADHVERLAQLLAGWNQLLTTANEALGQELDQETRIAICLRCAKWYGKYLERPDYAIPYYQQVLQLDPTHHAAMSQMADLYRQTGQWDTVYQVLARMLEVASRDEDKMDVYVQLGELCERQLGRPDQATQYYSAALELHGDHLPSLVALERIYRERGEWEKLVEVLVRKAAFRGGELHTLSEEDLAVVLAAKLELATVYRDQFNEVGKAIQQYEEVLAVEPSNLTALRGVEPLYQVTERWQDLPKVLETQLEVVSTEKERIAILLKLARVFEVEFVKPDKAAERLEQVLDIDPNHVEALSSLARLYRGLQRWDAVISTYERHVAATPTRAEKLEIYRALGDVYANELKDYDRAIDTYLNVTQIDEDDIEALHALSRLYEKTDNHAQAIEVLDRLARLVREPSEKVELHFRTGSILELKLGDRQEAVDHYQKAIDLDPSYLPALSAMRAVYVDSGDWIAAARILEREIQNTQNPRILTRLNVELGSIYREKLDEHKRSVAAFEAALRHDDTNEDAALALVDDYVKEERFREALPLLQLLVRQGGKRSPDENQRLSFLLGQAAAAVQDFVLAIKAYGQAYTVDPSHLPTIQGLAGAHYALRDWEKAGKFYQVLLMQHRDDLAPDEVVQAFHQLGMVKLEQNEKRKALNMFDKALEQDPGHGPTLERVIQLHADDGNWDQVIHYKKQLLEAARGPERLALLQEIADLWRDKLDNRQKAIESLADALVLEPTNHVLLHKLLQLYQETKQWKEAADIIQRVSDLDPRTSSKAKYAYTIGVILRDELKDVEGALARFNEALDADPTQLKPFEAINKLLNQLKDWKGLERAFRKMLHRVMALPAPDKELQFNLWHNLGIIYRDRLKQNDAAAQAFKLASELRPEDGTEHKILAELYGRMPDKFSEAVAEYEYLLRQDPQQPESYHALYKLYFDARDYDKAWCVARTLSVLKKADTDQANYYEQYKPASGNPSSRLTAQHWLTDLYHPDQDREVSMVFRALCGPLFESRYGGISDKLAGLAKLKPVDFSKETASIAQAFAMSMQVLSPDVRPRLFLRGDQPHGLKSILAAQPATDCGMLLLRGYKPKDLQFVTAHHLAYHRAEHYIRKMLPSAQELREALIVAMRSVGEGNADAEKVWAQLRSKMQPQQAEEIAKACKIFAKRGMRTDIKRWIQTVELTACRAGFLVSNDLESAISMLGQLESAGPDDLSPNEKVKELILFSVSQEYFRLREAIGIQLRIQ